MTSQPSSSSTLTSIATALQALPASSYPRIHRPAWCTNKDPLSAVVDGTPTLWKRGRVVWGALVQANSMLFEEGPHDAPMNALYSFDPWYADHPDLLARLGQAIAGLKGKDVVEHKGLDVIGKTLAAELERHFAQPVPLEVTHGREVFLTATMVFRAALPNRVLRDNVFPLCALPGEKVTAIPPSTTWPAELLQRWR